MGGGGVTIYMYLDTEFNDDAKIQGSPRVRDVTAILDCLVQFT